MVRSTRRPTALTRMTGLFWRIRRCSGASFMRSGQKWAGTSPDKTKFWRMIWLSPLHAWMMDWKAEAGMSVSFSRKCPCKKTHQLYRLLFFSGFIKSSFKKYDIKKLQKYCSANREIQIRLIACKTLPVFNASVWLIDWLIERQDHSIPDRLIDWVSDTEWEWKNLKKLKTKIPYIKR